MRPFDHSVVLGVAAAALLSLTPEPAQARGHRSYRAGCSPYPAPPVYSHWPAMPAYYPPPMDAPPPAYPPPPPPAYAAPSKAYPRASATAAVDIGAYDNVFQPATITVAPGTTVRWTNYGRHAHTVTSATGRWGSGRLAPGQVYSSTFTRPGTYDYHCGIHPREMRGTIVVR